MNKFWYWFFKILLWLVCLFLGLASFLVVVGPAGICLLGSIFLLAPIEDWQDLLERKMGKWVKIGLTVLLIAVGIFTYKYSLVQTNSEYKRAYELEETIQNAQLELEAQKNAAE